MDLKIFGTAYTALKSNDGTGKKLRRLIAKLLPNVPVKISFTDSKLYFAAVALWYKINELYCSTLREISLAKNDIRYKI